MSSSILSDTFRVNTLTGDGSNDSPIESEVGRAVWKSLKRKTLLGMEMKLVRRRGYEKVLLGMEMKPVR